jgi:uncharacterized protein (TIGR04255 family)
MAEYIPFREKHSIQEAQISLLFPGPFDQQAIEVARGFAQAELSDVLPRSAEVRGGSIRIDITNPAAPSPLGQMQSDLAGFHFSKVQANGQPARVLQLAGNTLSVSFMDYESWASTIQDSLRYLHPVLNSLPLETNPAISFGLRFVDRYTYSGNSGEARADLLFERGNPYLASHSFEAGSMWHCNSGWFDDAIHDDDRVLHNLNVTSSLVELSSTVTIDHQANRHLGAPRDTVTALLAPSGGAIGLAKALESLHGRNKSILGQALLPEMLAKIGMTK